MQYITERCPKDVVIYAAKDNNKAGWYWRAVGHAGYTSTPRIQRGTMPWVLVWRSRQYGLRITYLVGCASYWMQSTCNFIPRHFVCRTNSASSSLRRYGGRARYSATCMGGPSPWIISTMLNWRRWMWWQRPCMRNATSQHQTSSSSATIKH